MKNYVVIKQFIEHWKSLVKYPKGDGVLFRCLVVYHYNRRTLLGDTVAQIHQNGIEGSKVALIESSTLSSDEVHMDFSPDYQDYDMDDDYNLVISGSSTKMGGKYSVTITPTESLDPKAYWSGGST